VTTLRLSYTGNHQQQCNYGAFSDLASDAYSIADAMLRSGGIMTVTHNGKQYTAKNSTITSGS
jgi:hypothetical protein